MKPRVLRWGLLSTARINNALIPPITTSKRSRLVAVASRTDERADAYAKERSISRAYGSYEALLADPDIDAVYNPLPNHLHAEWTIKAAQAGKHVLCEKPLALSVEEVDAIASAAQKAGVVVSEAFMYRSHLQTIKVKELVDAGAIGELKVIRGAFTFFLDRPEDVRLNPEMGGGSIWDVGCYPISYARYIAGAEPEEVVGWQVTGPTGVDEVFTGMMRFPGGAAAVFDSGFRSPYHVFMEISGSEGNLRIENPFNPQTSETILFSPKKGDLQKIRVRGSRAYLGEVQDMEAAVLDGQPPGVSLADSRGTVSAIRALLASALQGAPVRL